MVTAFQVIMHDGVVKTTQRALILVPPLRGIEIFILIVVTPEGSALGVQYEAFYLSIAN